MNDADRRDQPETPDRPAGPFRLGLRREEWVLPAAVALGAGAYIYVMTGVELPLISDPLGPRAFPILVGVIGLACAAWLFLENLQRASRRRETGTPAPARHAERALPVVAGVLVWSLIYYSSFEALGFLFSTVVYLFVLTMLFDRKSWLMNGLFSLLVPLAVKFVFSDFLGIPFPDGPLGF